MNTGRNLLRRGADKDYLDVKDIHAAAGWTRYLLVEATGHLVGMFTRPYVKRGRRHIQTGVR